jgi:hypothetical protein
MSWTGSGSTRLIVLRGNSASGKSSVAAGIRSRYGRGVAIVGQDNLRRTVLRERDIPGGVNVGLIDTAEYGRAEMSGWYREHDLLGADMEHVIPAASSLDDTVERIMRETGLHARGAVLLAPGP